MAKKIKIKTQRETAIHFDGVFDDHTLCGLDTNGDNYLKISVPVTTNKKVNCKDCIKVFRFCKSIDEKELINPK